MCKLDESIKELAAYIDVDRMLNATGVVPFWIKDTNFRFLRYNQAMIDILYPGAQFNDLLNKADWEYISELGYPKNEVEFVKKGCKASDEDVLNSRRPSHKYFELVHTTDGSVLWLLTTKVRIPPEKEREKARGIYGTAITFPDAPKIISSKVMNTKQLTDTCYKILD